MAQSQILQWKSPKYKKFATREEAEAFVRAGKNPLNDKENYEGSPTSGAEAEHTINMTKSTRMSAIEGGVEEEVDDEDEADEGEPVAKKTTNATRKIDVLPEPAEEDDRDGGNPMVQSFISSDYDDFDPDSPFEDIPPRSGVETLDLNTQTTKPPSEAPPAVLHIYTDGSSRGNGQRGALAGIGVFFGPSDPRNISEPLAGPRQTNQRAELSAILRALETAPARQSVKIISDSEYSINCVTKWYKTWQRNGWMNSTGKPVENRDLVGGILDRMEERRSEGGRTDFLWVRGHNKDPGNEAADRLAVSGAIMGGR